MAYRKRPASRTTYRRAPKKKASSRTYSKRSASKPRAASKTRSRPQLIRIELVQGAPAGQPVERPETLMIRDERKNKAKF